MYRLMKSQRFTLERAIAGSVSLYRQVEVGHFERFKTVLGACKAANKSGEPRHYLLNACGQELYRGHWVG